MLNGKTIVVTGAARGLGAEIAKGAIAAGAKVIIGDILEVEGREMAAKLGAIFHPLDLASRESITRFAAQCGNINGLVNNGAIATNVGGIGFEEVDPALFARVMQVNVIGLWEITRAFSPNLIGNIVNIASDTALWGAPNLISYVASKGAMMAMTRSLARELGPRNIAVTCIAPGILTTESTQYVPEHRHKLYENGRAIQGKQDPAEIVPTIIHLLTPAARALTGQTLPVNNGFVFN